MEPTKDPTMSDPLHAESRAARLDEPVRADGPDFNQIPLIDFSGMLGTHAASKACVAAAVRDACIDVGFFYVSNHGVPAELIATMFAQAPRFFERPLGDKMRWHVKNSSHFLGYVAMRDENANPAVGKGDLHEAFD